MKLHFFLVLLLPTISVAYAEDRLTARLTQRTLKEQQKRQQEKRSLFELSHAKIAARLLEDQPKPCDAAFTTCLTDEKCVECFLEMNDDDLDWAAVTPDTQCSELLDIVFKTDHCLTIRSDTDAQALFCSTFESCIVDTPDSSAQQGLDCSTLTECEWPGKHAQFIGDGVCHAHLPGCYNTAVCGWDGGDCCPDTCSTNSTYVECGSDGYWCLDPSASGCDTRLTNQCQNSTNPDTPNVPDCEVGTTAYRVMMFDSFGDGWDNTKLSINEAGFETSLEDGSSGTDYVCLSTTAKCYTVDATGGVWGNEVSWEIRPLADGASQIAGGGSPQSCAFSVAGGDCETTCSGPPKIFPTDDPDYSDFKKMYNCINDKCKIQVASCQSDETCSNCFTENVQQFCYNDENFVALSDCSLCKCTDDAKDQDFCEKKLSPNVVPSNSTDVRPQCSPVEKGKGSQAVLRFASCTDMDQLSMLLTHFDQSHFGGLDKFEACAHAFRDGSDSHTALGCMQLLVNTANNKTESDEDTPQDAVAALSGLLYHTPQEFCECASRSSEECPACPDFANFKTLLYESLDACQSLDEIDCDAWHEFYPTCKQNLLAIFDNEIDFAKPDQCQYVAEGCGNAGPFPAFRRLDCVNELPTDEWRLFEQYTASCLADDSGQVGPPTRAPVTQVVPDPTPPPAMSPVQPTPVTPSAPSYNPPIPEPPATPSYVSPEERNKKQPSKSRSHWFRNLVVISLLCGAAYFFWKRRSEFSFHNYRRARNYGMADDGMLYSGLTMESSTTFQPPTLPPTPQAIGGDQYYS